LGCMSNSCNHITIIGDNSILFFVVNYYPTGHGQQKGFANTIWELIFKYESFSCAC